MSTWRIVFYFDLALISQRIYLSAQSVRLFNPDIWSAIYNVRMGELCPYHAIELINTTSTRNRFEHSSAVYTPYNLIEHYNERPITGTITLQLDSI